MIGKRQKCAEPPGGGGILGVVHNTSTERAIGLALAGRATLGNDANFGDFGITTPLDNPVVP